MKVAIVTGSNSGIGQAIVQRLVELPDFHVIMACRNSEKAQVARKEILSQVSEEAKKSGAEERITFLKLDLADPVSIFQAADTLKQKYKRIDVLFANAGIFNVLRNNYFELMRCVFEEGLEGFFVKGGKFLVQPTGQVTRDGYGEIFMSNIFGHYIFIREIEDLLAGGGRIVWSGSHSACKEFFDPQDIQHLEGETPYQSSKFATDLLSLSLNERLREKEIYSFNTAPGFVLSALSFLVLPPIIWYWFVIPMMVLMRSFIPTLCIDPISGCEANIYVATHPKPSTLIPSQQYVSMVTYEGSRLSDGQGATRYVEPRELPDIDIKGAAKFYDEIERMRLQAVEKFRKQA